MRLGIDLGGTKIAAIVLAADGRVLWERRVPTPRHDYQTTIDRLAELVADAEAHVGESCQIGIGIPGTISAASSLVKNANSVWLIGHPLLKDLVARFGPRVRLENDANCFARSESADGAAAGAHVVFGVILGTGVGGGMVVDGRIVAGANGIGGEWGHNPLPWPEDDERPGPACYCGRQGCIETFLSGPAISADYARRGGESDVIAEDIVRRAAAGEALATASLEAWHRRLAKSLASVINILDPDVIVAGGGLSNIPGVYERVVSLWRPYVFSDAVVTRFVPARHGDASGVRGAAWLWSAAPTLV